MKIGQNKDRAYRQADQQFNDHEVPVVPGSGTR